MRMHNATETRTRYTKVLITIPADCEQPGQDIGKIGCVVACRRMALTPCILSNSIQYSQPYFGIKRNDGPGESWNMDKTIRNNLDLPVKLNPYGNTVD